jgi:hypothetical protein
LINSSIFFFLVGWKSNSKSRLVGSGSSMYYPGVGSLVFNWSFRIWTCCESICIKKVSEFWSTLILIYPLIKFKYFSNFFWKTRRSWEFTFFYWRSLFCFLTIISYFSTTSNNRMMPSLIMVWIIWYHYFIWFFTGCPLKSLSSPSRSYICAFSYSETSIP